MTYVKHEQMTLSPTTSGPWVGYSTGTYNGLLRGFAFVNSTTPLSTNNNITVVGERIGRNLLNVDQTTGNTWWQPYSTGHTSTGGSLGSPVPFPVFDERLKVTVTSGSTAGTASAFLDIFVE